MHCVFFIFVKVMLITKNWYVKIKHISFGKLNENLLHKGQRLEVLWKKCSQAIFCQIKAKTKFEYHLTINSTRMN